MDLSSAMHLARLYEQRVRVLNQQPCHATPQMQQTLSVKRLNRAEMEARRAKGLFFNVTKHLPGVTIVRNCSGSKELSIRRRMMAKRREVNRMLGRMFQLMLLKGKKMQKPCKFWSHS